MNSLSNKDIKDKLERRLISRFHKALSEFQLVSDGDKILVGLSGGKDSLFLLEMLARRMKIERPAFKVEAIHVRMDNIKYESDTRYLESFCESFNVPLHIITAGFDSSTDHRKTNCFLCSWTRRKVMFNFAQENGFNKLALGHHMDDIIHTAIMNEFFQGHFSTMPLRLKMRKMPLTIIRPLGCEHESDILEYAMKKGYQKQLKSCPYEKDSHRETAKKLFQQIEEINPEARYSMWNALLAEGKLTEE